MSATATGVPSYPNSDVDTQSLSTTHEMMDDEEMNKLMGKNGHTLNNDDNLNNDLPNIPRKSISREHSQPRPPLHAQQSIVNENGHDFDEIVKNNPYKHRKIITSNQRKRIIRPINAQYYMNGAGSKNIASLSNNHTIVAMHHHKKESKTIDAFLKNRLSESELQSRQILPSNVESNDYRKGQQFWQQKHKKTEQLKTNLNRKLNAKFRPQQKELYNRGIYVTDPSVKYFL